VQQHKHLGRWSRADPLASSLLMLRARFGAGNRLRKTCRSRTDAMTCACIVAVCATCRQMPHGSVTHMLPGCQQTSLQKIEKPKQLVYKSHIVGELQDNIWIWYCGAPCGPLKTDLILLWMIIDCIHKQNSLVVLKHTFPFLPGRSNSVFSYYCLLFS